jgi:hypothetical protein
MSASGKRLPSGKMKQCLKLLCKKATTSTPCSAAMVPLQAKGGEETLQHKQPTHHSQPKAALSTHL